MIISQNGVQQRAQRSSSSRRQRRRRQLPRARSSPALDSTYVLLVRHAHGAVLMFDFPFI
ncbi:hypothetical protein AURDEDRAFT_178157 [Auricularia subglabra TFB-10046 SS5]|uniref:Uncharacterized protein n=1 Tax=Auricularia subglabra (strain TFB-10046 / SS5) TaxID=717982 RepID=J0WKB7_AURST|nr:hypothetical protein AURDEDRAFT_178157 [Auricularia subglabra TFB-10046 SS5]